MNFKLVDCRFCFGGLLELLKVSNTAGIGETKKGVNLKSEVDVRVELTS